jgi:hypothetical protein
MLAWTAGAALPWTFTDQDARLGNGQPAPAIHACKLTSPVTIFLYSGLIIARSFQ